MTIRRLDPAVADLIAAGEVVERPASVLKELLENSLDAGATDVRVRVEGAGQGLIEVADDGSGIPPGELELALAQHATSKIQGRADLDSIATLGFRGEALAAVAAVSDLTLTSRTASSSHAATLEAQGGRLGAVRPAARGTAGTTVSVRRLFYNTPARRAFLKSPAAENGLLARVLRETALAAPEVRLSLEAAEGGPRALSLPGGGWEATLAALYPAESSSGGLLPLDHSTSADAAGDPGSEVTVSGVAGHPEHSRGTRQDMVFVVNGRRIWSRALQSAVEEAYRGRLLDGRFPIAVVKIQVAPSCVDVNVHPTKREVRFRAERVVWRAVQQAVWSALEGRAPHRYAGAAMRGQAVEESRVAWSTRREPFPPSRGGPALPGIVPEWQGEAFPAPPDEVFESLRLLGQVLDSYLLAETREGLAMIDQHAAHERVLLHRLRSHLQRGGLNSQLLLLPLTIALEAPQEAALEGVTESLAGLGVEVAAFGPGQAQLRAVPEDLTGADWEGLLPQLLSRISEGDGGGLEVVRDEMLALMACHGAVRAGQTLATSEQSALLRDLRETPDRLSCPHGRPVLVVLGRREIDSAFQRR